MHIESYQTLFGNFTLEHYLAADGNVMVAIRVVELS